MAKRKVDLSIIVLSYNTKQLLKNCLESVVRSREWGVGNQELNKKQLLITEIIVVDNASTDSSPEMVRKEFSAKGGPASGGPKVKLIRSKKNLGFAGGNNLGLKKATGKYILFLNSDTEVAADAFRKMITFMDRNLKVGASTAKTVLFSGGMDPDCHRGFPAPWASICYFLGLEHLFPKSRIFGQYHQFYLDLNKAHEIDAGFGTFMFVRREVLDQVGNWDESYFFYGEDLDLFYRIKQAGWKVMFYPEPLVVHHKGASSGLRRESKKVTRADRKIRIKTAKASIKAMEIFYNKFYKDKYSSWVTWTVILGIKIKGFFRVIYHYLR